MIKVFPTRRGERSSEERNAEFLRLLRSRRKAIIKTCLAALSAFGFMLQTLHGREPRLVFIVIINPLDTERFCVSFGLVLADLVFLERVDIGIEIVDDGRDIMRQQPLYNG